MCFAELVVCTEYFVHVYMRADGLCGCVTCDSEYPPRVAFSLLTKLLEDFEAQVPSWSEETRNESIIWPPLDTAIAKYQDPAEADQIMRIQRNLDDTRDVLHNTIGEYIYIYLFWLPSSHQQTNLLLLCPSLLPI